MIGRVALFLRGAATTPALSVSLVVVIAALTFVGASVPGVLDTGRSATVQRAVESVPALTRWPSATGPGLPAFGRVSQGEVGVWAGALAAVEQKRQEQPEPLRSLLGAPRLSIMIDPIATTDENPDRVKPVPFNKVGLVSDPGLVHRSDLIEGTLPELTDPADGVQIALTETVAQQLEWEVGTQRRWNDLVLTLTGIVSPSERDRGDWTFINGSIEPLIEVDAGGNRILVVAGFMHVDEVAAFTDRVSDIKVTAWMPFDLAAIDTDTAADAAAQLRLLTADPVHVPLYGETFFNRGMPLRSALPQAIDGALIQADAMTPVVTVAAVGPTAVALVVLTLLSRLIALRRATAIRVLRARGASTGRLVALLGGEGLVLGVLGAVIGSGVAAAFAPGGTESGVLLASVLSGLLIPALFAVVPAVVLPWGALVDAERRGRSDLGETGKSGQGRVLLEALALVVTGVLAVLIATRGNAGGADPLLLTLVVLLGVAGSILTLRLLPVVLQAAENRGRRRASLTALLGPARARRDVAVRAAPVLAVVMGVGVAVFSVAFAATVSTGIVRAAVISVGAEVRIDAAYITDSGADRVAELDGVAASSALRGGATVEVATEKRAERSRVYSVDRNSLVDVQHGSAAAIPLPAALAEPADSTVPVVISDRLLALLGADSGEGLELTVDGVHARVVGVAPALTPFGSAEQWVIIDDVNAASLPRVNRGISRLYLALDPDQAPDAVGASAVAALGGDAAYQTPAGVAADRAADPGYRIVQGALLGSSVIVATLLALAVVATLLLGAGSRARMLAILRTLGHAPRTAWRLVMWEVVPALLLALPFGALAGVVMAWLVIPQLDLRGFVGGSEQPPVVLGGAWLLAAVIGFALVAALAVTGAAAAASRLGSAEAIRQGDGREQ